MSMGLRHVAAGGLASAVVCVVVTATTAGSSQAVGAPSGPAWTGFANNAQHTAVAPVTPQPLDHIHWHVKVDHHPGTIRSDDGPASHYASPMITSTNTVIVPTRLGKRRGFEVVAYAGADGTRLWRFHTDATTPLDSEPQSPPPLPATLRDDTHVAVAGAGGTLLIRRHVDRARGGVRRVAFYGLGRWRAHRRAYRQDVHITTPLTAGPDGSLYFGFAATPDAPGHLRNGIARISPSGRGSWVSARALAGHHRGAHVVDNCAPALSNDGRTGYVALLSHKTPTLVGFHSTDLRPEFRHELRDPQTHKPASILFDASSATPTIGPDGDVFYGVLGNPLVKHDVRGWLLHFDAHLTKVETPGSFGWDQSVSVLPASSVPSYQGSSSYLLVSKYNNYTVGPHGDGRNELALLDPHAAQKDDYSRVQVMREVSTVLSPHHPPHTPKGARYEWCVNSISVDPATGTAIANNEDGRLYRWNLETNTLDQQIRLGPGVGQAYTMTVVGPDGTSYAIENAVLYAVGS
jgi:hypothetical protein